MPAPLTQPEKDYLLDLAYRSVEAAANRRPLPVVEGDLPYPRLMEPGASFVTLTIRGQLRGCIGTIQARLPLVQDVILHAADAALRDPRFPPVQPDEVPHIDVEVSVLTNPEPLQFETPEEIPSLLRPHVDGVILRLGNRRATFLPQVWEKLPDPEEFLNRLCEKAYLPTECWKSEPVEIATYQVESFHRHRGEDETPTAKA